MKNLQEYKQKLKTTTNKNDMQIAYEMLLAMGYTSSEIAIMSPESTMQTLDVKKSKILRSTTNDGLVLNTSYRLITIDRQVGTEVVPENLVAAENPTEGVIQGGVYEIINASTNKLMYITNNSIDTETEIKQTKKSGNYNEQFVVKINGVESELYSYNMLGMNLDIANASPDDDTVLQTYYRNKTIAQNLGFFLMQRTETAFSM